MDARPPPHPMNAQKYHEVSRRHHLNDVTPNSLPTFQLYVLAVLDKWVCKVGMTGWSLGLEKSFVCSRILQPIFAGLRWMRECALDGVGTPGAWLARNVPVTIQGV